LLKQPQKIGKKADYWPIKSDVIGQKLHFSAKIGGKFFFPGLKNDSGLAIVMQSVVFDELKIR